MIKAEIIADSINQWGNRLTSFVCVFPRIVLAEFNTHRMLSKNSSSSRAIPFEKMVKMVQEDPFIPIKWMKDHKGMQGTDYFTEDSINLYNTSFFEKYYKSNKSIDIIESQWMIARDASIEQAMLLNNLGLTKQICNRLLEPFMWHTVIVTGTEWENFFALRAHPQAEIHIQDLAYKMLEAYNASTPKLLKEGEWHIPFGDKIDEDRLYKTVYHREGINKISMDTTRAKIATARCARVSYLNFEGKDDYEADLKLHDNLLTAGHMSPFEHCGRAMTKDEYEKGISGQVNVYNDWGGTFTSGLVVEVDPKAKGWSGNFRGFVQYRKMLAGENKIDNRVNQKHEVD